MTIHTEDTDKARPAPKDRNSQCIDCGRQCYNSGLCMMPWPGLKITEAKQPFLKRKKQVVRPDRTCRTHHAQD